MHFTSLITPSTLAMCGAASTREERRPYLGCSLRSMIDAPGMMVLLVNTESPAWDADMKVGDILLEIDGKPINLITEF